MPVVTMIYRRQITLSANKMEQILMTPKKENTKKSNQPSVRNNGGVYEIKIKGLLDDHWQQWFEGMILKRQESAVAGQDTTIIRGWIVDQPALHGLLAKIRDLNLPLISVTEIKSADMSNPEGDQNDEEKNPRRS
jgi:hypothetical protein